MKRKIKLFTALACITTITLIGIVNSDIKDSRIAMAEQYFAKSNFKNSAELDYWQFDGFPRLQQRLVAARNSLSPNIPNNFTMIMSDLSLNFKGVKSDKIELDDIYNMLIVGHIRCKLRILDNNKTPINGISIGVDEPIEFHARYNNLTKSIITCGLTEAR